MNFSIVCINSLRDLRELRCFLRPCCCSYGHDCGSGGGGSAVLLFHSTSIGIRNTPGSSAMVPTEWWSHQRYIVNAMWDSMFKKVTSIRTTHGSFPLCSLPWKNAHQLPQLETINPGSLTVRRNSLWTIWLVCGYIFPFPF